MPKPKSEQPKEVKLSFDERTIYKNRVKEPKKLELTDEQKKWDVEDQSFIKKEFEREKKEEIEHELAEEDEGDVQVDKIEWLNEEKPKIKEIDLTKEVDSNWKKESVAKNQFKT